jgi:alcohol dehydrogenase
LGGGSVIDTAKVAACLLAEPSLNLKDLLIDPVGSPRPRIYLIAIPTTAGTGAEVTPFATVWDRGVEKKYSVINVAPDVAILDPGLTLSLPRQETIYTALDALSHALESLWNKNRTPESAVYAQESIEEICQALPQVLSAPGNYPARQQLQIAATLAGIAISQTRTAIAHAISYSLTAKYGVPHGLACSFTLAAIMREVGKDRLEIPESLFDKTWHLLEKLQLDKEIERYVDWQNIIGQAEIALDPSRAGNFIIDIDSGLIKRLMSGSNAVLSEGKHNEN